jgi:lipopolysaccharide export LptBFGC system permease protein LptF
MIRQSLAIHLGLSIVIAVCTGVPASVAAVIQSLWSSLVSDLGTLAMLQLVVGALPTAFYVLLPAACVIAICWLYWAGSDSNAIPAMYAAGISVYTCARPAILTVALLATVSAVDAWVVAPRGVGMVEDVKYQLHHTVNIGSLAEGQFHSLNFEGGNATISFRKSLGDNRFEGFFFASVNSRTKKRFAISARRAVITRDRSKMTIIFESGTRIDLKSRSQSAIVAFRSYKLSLPSYSESNSINRTKVTIPEMNLEQLCPETRRRAESWSASPKAKWQSDF